MEEEYEASESERMLLAIEHDKAIPFTERGLEIKTLHDLRRVATYLQSSNFVPRGDSVADVMIKIQMGRELGLSLMNSLNRICVTNGRPSIWGEAVPALCYGTKELELFKEFFEGEPYKDNYTAVCIMKRKGFDEVRRSFSVAQAKLAGLWQKRGKDNYPTTWVLYPDRMLQMRARGYCARDTFPDALCGLYLVEEAQDIEPAQDVVISDAEPDAQTVPADFVAATEKLRKTSPKRNGNGRRQEAAPEPVVSSQERVAAETEAVSPAEQARQALFAQLETAAKELDAETFDAHCAAIAKDTPVAEMSAVQIGMLLDLVKGPQETAEPVPAGASAGDLF